MSGAPRGGASGLAPFALLVFFALSCAGGAPLGDPCSTPGSLDECAPGTVCASPGEGGPVCMKACRSGEDCGASASCAEIAPGVRACQPGWCLLSPDKHPAHCTATGSACVALAAPEGRPRVLLRIAHLTIQSPEVLARGIVKHLIDAAVQVNLPECQLAGDGTFSWLLEFDLGAGLLRTGGARPAAHPTDGYCFVEDTLFGFEVAPVMTTITVGQDGAFDAAPIADLVVPLYGESGTVVLLPLHDVRLSEGTLSPDRACIGVYNGAGLRQLNLCQPEEGRPAFLDAATVAAHLSLEEADDVLIPELGATLCTLLAGDDDGGEPRRCRRDASGGILFQGDWCAIPPGPATASCHDAVRLVATFAASAVELAPGCGDGA